MWLSANLFAYKCHQKSGKFLHGSWNHNENKALKNLHVYKFPKVILKVLNLHFWTKNLFVWDRDC